MAQSLEYDLPPIEQGADYYVSMTLYNPDGSLMSLNGATVSMMVRTSPGTAYPVLQTFSSANGYIQVQPTSPTTDLPLEGNITISVPGAITQTITWVSGYYDIKITWADKQVTRILQGQITVNPGVTV